MYTKYIDLKSNSEIGKKLKRPVHFAHLLSNSQSESSNEIVHSQVGQSAFCWSFVI